MGETISVDVKDIQIYCNTRRRSFVLIHITGNETGKSTLLMIMVILGECISISTLNEML